jgi:protein KRI1
VNAAQLDDDWDPEAHEALMAAQFGDDYYGDEDAGDDFGDDAEAHRFALEAAAEDAGLGWEGEDEEGAGGLQALAGEDEEVAVDAALPALSKSKRQRNRDKKAAKAREGALGAADEDAGLDAAALEELYALDYEDVIGGDTLCRFRYRQVETQDYGLTVDDILAADDKELNQFRSIKKYSAYRHGDAPAGPDGGARHAYGRDDDEEEASKLSKKRKRLRAAIRERAAEEAARLAAVEADAPTASVASLLAPKKAASAPAAETADSDGDGDSDDGARKPGEKRKRKRKHKKSGAADDDEKEKEQEKETSSVKVVKKAEKAPAHVAATAAAAPDAAAAKKKKKHSGAKPKARDPQEVRMSLYR